MSQVISVGFEHLYINNGDMSDENISTGITIVDPTDDIKTLLKPHEIVIPMPKIIIRVDYPLRKSYDFEISAPTPAGFTRSVLICEISNIYHKIYEESRYMKNDDIPTGRKYDIYGHRIDDLLLCGVTQIAGNLFELSVDS
jgi:hypothetical protein